MKKQGWILGVIGLWIVLTGFIGLGRNAIFWSNLLSGLIIMRVAMDLSRGKIIAGWFALFFGIWMVLTAFIPGFQAAHRLFWNALVAGGLTAITGFASLTAEATLPSYEVKQHG